MVPAENKHRNGIALSVLYCWLLVIFLIPFFAGGVIVGDEVFLLRLVYGLDQSSQSFANYVRSSEGWYISHHVLWFGLLYATAHIGALLKATPLVLEALISCETVAAALAGIALCYIFLIRWQGLSPTRAGWIVLAFFAGGYGVFTFSMGGTVESYMVLAMSARLHWLGKPNSIRSSPKLAIVDAVLVALKGYSVIFIFLTWLFLRPQNQNRRAYFIPFVSLMICLGIVKLWLWNPIYISVIKSISVRDMFSHFWQQFLSPWTGLFFCLPVLLALFWTPKVNRVSVVGKIVALCGCAAFFSLYSFFNGDVPGGRYMFPFVIALLPEIAIGASRLLDRTPRAAWLLPLAIVAFLPVAALGFPFLPNGVLPSLGRCQPEHPVIYSWRILVAKINNSQRVEFCFHKEKYVLSARDVASPHLGLWRVAYLLDGGHSPAYRAYTHDKSQIQHDAWGARLSELLRGLGLGNSLFWKSVGLIPAILVLLLSVLAALRINRSAGTPARAV